VKEEGEKELRESRFARLWGIEKRKSERLIPLTTYPED